MLRPQQTPVVARFAELEHKAIGDRALQNVRYSLAPLVQMTHGDIVAMGDYFSSPDEIASLAKTPGMRKGTLGEVYYALYVKIQGKDEKPMMGEWFDKSAKEAVNERFYKLAAKNVSDFHSPRTGDTELDQGTKAKRHDSPGHADGGAATYRDSHVRAIRRALELGRAGKPVGGALAIDAFSSHFLTDGFSAGHIRTPRTSVQQYGHKKLPDFFKRFQRCLADTVLDWVEHNPSGLPLYKQILGPLAPKSYKRKVALEQVQAALKTMLEMTFGDVIAGAIHDFDSDRGVVVEVGGKRMRMVGDGRLLDPEGDDDAAHKKASADTMSLAVKAVEASVADVEKAYSWGASGVELDEAIKRLTSANKGMFASEAAIPKPVPDAQLTAADKSLTWHFETVEELLEDKRMRKALVVFANEKASMFDAIMETTRACRRCPSRAFRCGSRRRCRRRHEHGDRAVPQDHPSHALSWGYAPSARCAAMPSTAMRPPMARPERIRGVIQRPAWPAARLRTRCQPPDATPTPSAKAAAAAGLCSDSEAATAAKEAIVSGLAPVIARKRM